MNVRDSHQEFERQFADPPVPRPCFPKRLWRRMVYWVIAGSFAGATLGNAADGLAGAAVWGAAGAVFGAFFGVLIGGYAWVLQSPLHGAVRGGGLFATATGLSFIALGMLPHQGWTTLVMVAGIAALIGGLTCAFVAWVAGPILQTIVQEADRGDSPLKSRPWW